MGILDFIKKYYNRCNKEFLYLGIALIVGAVILLGEFWGFYTTAAGDIRLQDDSLHYQGINPGETERVHGKITEIDYYGKVTPDIPDMKGYEEGHFNLSSDTYLEGRLVVDNLTMKKARVSNATISGVLIYNGEFSALALDNITFNNVDFIHTTFSQTVFMNVKFQNSTFVDCSFTDSRLNFAIFSNGYSRDVDFSKVIMKDSTMNGEHLDSVEFKHVEAYSSTFSSLRVNHSLFRGVKFQDTHWSGNRYYNNTFDVISFSGLRMENCTFPESTFQNIFQNQELDHTFIRAGDLYIRVRGDITTLYNKGTSFYGEVKLEQEEGNLSAISGQGVHYNYQIFIEKGLHHSIRIDGIFYVIILGGLTSITYAFGGKAIVVALVKFFLPFVFSAIGILVLYFSLDWSTFETLGTWMILYFFPPLGKESVIPAAIAQGIAPWLIASAVAFIDIMVGLFLVWNFDLARKIPLIGGFIRRIEDKGQDILEKKPWVERLAFTGLVLFVMFPFQGSGAVGATIIGRMLGMEPKKIWFAVILGALIGCFMIAYASAFAITFLLGVNLLYAVLSIVIIAIFVLLIYNYEKFGDWVRERL